MAAPIYTQPLPSSFSPLVSDAVITDTDTFGGTLSITELAESIRQKQDNTPLRALFPEEKINAETVRIVQEINPGVGTTLPLVAKGMSDVFLSSSGSAMSERIVQPFYMRGSFFLSHGAINSRVRLGTVNERWSPADQIAKKVQEMMDAHELTWDVIRTYILNGGFEFNDPRTNNRTEIPSNIPANNLFSYNVRSGYKGRQEHAWFRSLVDANVPDAGSAPSGIPWTHPDAAIVECVRNIAHWYRMTYDRSLTSMYLHPEMIYVLSMNRQILNAVGPSFVPKFGAVAGDSAVSVQPSSLERGALGLNGVAVDDSGTIRAIAGINVYPLQTKFKDPRDGTIHSAQPKNRVILVSTENGVAPGRTQYCISEEMGGEPGLWSRTNADVPAPSAPGYAFQIGNAGMVYLMYPEHVVHLNVCEVEDIQRRLVTLGDYDRLAY